VSCSVSRQLECLKADLAKVHFYITIFLFRERWKGLIWAKVMIRDDSEKIPERIGIEFLSGDYST
jgi:ABC-type glycerol-3-phosphate transport system permease component